jgi:hypothetical protein
MWYKLTLPLVICFGVGVLAFVQEFVPHPWSAAFREEMTTWFRIMGGFGLFIGAYSLLHLHVTRIRRQQAGWGYSAFVFLGAALTIGAGVFEEVRAAVADVPAGAFSLFDWLYNYVQVPCQATIFSILAFFMASAAFRAFRARNVEAALLLAAALVVMFGRVPISEEVGRCLGSWDLFPKAADVLMEYPNMAAKRGIMLGISLGAISQSLRVLFGIERSYLGGGG